MKRGHPLQDVVDAGYAPSLRWLATEIKQGRVPGRMIGRYWRNWRMTEDDLTAFLEASQPATAVAPTPEPPESRIIAGLSSRAARRLKSAS